jgi:hypothetical protein
VKGKRRMEIKGKEKERRETNAHLVAHELL